MGDLVDHPAEMMADTGNYSVDRTTILARVSAAGEKVGLIDRLLAARVQLWL